MHNVKQCTVVGGGVEVSQSTLGREATSPTVICCRPPSCCVLLCAIAQDSYSICFTLIFKKMNGVGKKLRVMDACIGKL